MAVTGVFSTPHQAMIVIGQLERAGVPASSITVTSSEPLHIEVQGSSKSRIAGFAIAGGLIGAGCAVALTIWTSRQVGLVTGGMPIISPWAFGIIVFELTALGAILAALGRLIGEAGLGRRFTPGASDLAVADGLVVVSVECEDDAAFQLARAILAPSD
jgi:hypothetical protein